MAESSGKKLLISEPSKLISSILESKLKAEGYNVFVFPDELKVFKEIMNIKPDCILLDSQLSKITGSQVCNLIKNSIYSSIPVIIYSIDEDYTDFLLENSGAESIVYLNPEKLDDLIIEINKNIKSNSYFDFYESNFKDKVDSETPILCALNAMEKNRFYYYILKSLFDLAFYINDFDIFVERILTLLNKICNFDVAVLICNQNPFYVYVTNIKGFSSSDKYDFLKICKSDFESNLGSSKNYPFIEKNINIFHKEKNLKGQKFASYKSFPLMVMGDDYMGTIHLASVERNLFKNSVCDNILFFVEKVSVMFDQALKYKTITQSDFRMRSAFSKFVPNEIIDDLISSDTKLNKSVNEKRKVAILICDIRNFTNISEVNEPENVVSFLNGYFKEMVKIIKKYGGTIDKFIGDAIMALFGAPISYEDNAERALRAACEMITFLPKISCKLIKIPEGLKFDIGIGIHYGEVIVGSIGCEDKSDYTVIGDSANLTSRLEGLTKIYDSKIIISQAVKDELNDEFNLLNVDTVKVKGKKKGVPIYRVDLEPLSPNYISNYSKGLILYKDGAWNLALGYFYKAAEYKEGDKASVLMIERCNEFIKNPPKNWEGAISLTSK